MSGQVFKRVSEATLSTCDFVFWRAAGRPGPHLSRPLTYEDINATAATLGCNPVDLWIGKVGAEDPSAVTKIKDGGPWEDDDPEIWVWDMVWHSTTTFLFVREREPNGFERQEGQPKWIDYAYPVHNVQPYATPLHPDPPVEQPSSRGGLWSRLFSRK